MSTTSSDGPASSEFPVEPAIRLIPLGGLGEIGLNMMLLECEDDLLAIDCGVLFPDD